MSGEQPFLQFLEKYKDHCELFVREVLGFPNEKERAEGKDVYPWQSELMAAYDRRERRISVKSGHGVGKTTVLAWLAIHHQVCRFPQKTAVTAPTEKQLFDAFWAEFKTWVERLPLALRELLSKPVKSDRCELLIAPSESFVSIKTSRPEAPEAMQGVHSPGFVLLIADEASGIAEVVFESAVGSMSGHNAMTILAGNPVRAQGFFFDTHGKLADMWWTRTVPCSEVPSGVTQDFAYQVERTYGRDSNAYRVRVLGEFPTSEDNVVVPFDLVEAATTRDVKPTRTAPVVWGVDVARYGSDRSAIAKRRGNELLEPVRWRVKMDTMAVAGWVKQEYDMTQPLELRPTEINIDSIGMGAGVVDRLRELGLPARGINVSESPAAVNKDLYANLRAELWFKMREWFNARDVIIPKQDDLIEELTKPLYKYRPQSNKLLIESKDELKKRGQRSPDLADAMMLTFASDAMILAHGRSAFTSWKTKLSRPLKGLV